MTNCPWTKKTDELVARLRRIVPPPLEFKDVPLHEAVEILRLEANRLDALDIEPKPGGIPIVLIAPPENLETRVTLGGDAGLGFWSFEGVSLFVWLWLVAEKAGLEMRCNFSGVYLCTPDMGMALDAAIQAEVLEALQALPATETEAQTPAPPCEPLPRELQEAIAAKYPGVFDPHGPARRAFSYAYVRPGAKASEAMAIADRILPDFIHDPLPVIYLPEVNRAGTNFLR